MSKFKINLILSGIIDDSTLSEFKNELSDSIEVKTLYHGKFANADGGGLTLIISLIAASSEGFFSGVGEYLFDLIISKSKKIIDKYSSKSKASFEFDLSEGEIKRIFKAKDISDETVQKALSEFKKIAMTKGENATYIFQNTTWISQNTDETKEYLQKKRDEAHQKFDD